jgi:hypothetical protein
MDITTYSLLVVGVVFLICFVLMAVSDFINR